MRKCMSGAAEAGAAFAIAVMLFSLLMLCMTPTTANPDVAGEVWFTAAEYFTDSVAVVYLNDSDRNLSSAVAEQVTVTVNSTANLPGISIILTETGTNTGIFNGTFRFAYNTSSSAGRLNVTDRSNVTVQYADSAPLPSRTRYSHTMFNHTVNATFIMNATIFGITETVNVTMHDNDTNADSGSRNSINAVVQSPGGGNITIALNETGVNTGVFEGNFTFNTTGNSSNDSADVLGTEEGDMITIFVTDSLNSYGSSVTVINTSCMASNATILFDNVTYYPADTAIVTVYDNDTLANINASAAGTVTVNVTSGADRRGINVTLTETGVNTGIFRGNFTFRNNLPSDDANNRLNATDSNTITAAYRDLKNGAGGRNTRITNSTPKYYYTVSGAPRMGLSLYGPNSTVNVTLNDSDRNTDPLVAQQVTVLVNSTTNATGINLILIETGVNTGIFERTFSFSISGNTSSTGRLLNASHRDEINVIYSDSTNSSGDFAVVTANATFYRTLNAILGSGGKYINSTYVAVSGNSTVLVNVTDRDIFADGNGSAYNTVTVVVKNTDTGCAINLTLNETNTNTGVFQRNFSLNETVCSNALRVMNFTAGGEDWLDINYTDPRNGTANANATVNYRLLADDKAPVFLSVSGLDADLIYRPGDMVNISVRLDQIGGSLSANFSVIDSTYRTGAENVTDYGNGSYLINYTISSSTNIRQGRYRLNITANDSMGNGPRYDNSLLLTLTRMSVNETMVSFTNLSPKGYYTVGFNVSNDGGRQALITETITTYKEYQFDYTAVSNGTRTFYFVAPENSTRIEWRVGSNESWAPVSHRLYDSGKVMRSSALSGSYGVSLPISRAEVWYMVVTAGNVSSAGVRITSRVSVYFRTPGWFNSSVRSGTDNFTANSDRTIWVNLTIPIRGVLPGMFNGTIVYNNTNTTASLSFIFNITSPEQRFESNVSSPVSLMPNGTITMNVNLMRGLRTLEIVINNTGNENLTGIWANLTGGNTKETNLTRTTASRINISAITGNVSAGSEVGNRLHMTFPNLIAGSSAWLRLHFNTSQQATEGIYKTELHIFSADGQPYNESNITIRINLTSVLNATVLNITYNGASPAKPRPGRNVTINLSVKYQNGDPVTGLVLGNFSIYDIWTTGSGSVINSTRGNLSIHDFSLSGSGFYMFNYTVPPRTSAGRAEHGMHRIILEARASNGNKGNASAAYNVSAPNIDLVFYSFSASMTNGSSDNFNINVRNNGTVTIYNVIINFTKNSTCITLNSTSCPLISNITVGRNATACTVRVTAGASRCTANITFTGGGVNVYGVAYNVTRSYKIADVTASGGSSSNPPSNGNTGETTSTCTSDSDCSALYFCNDSGYCERIVCTDGFIGEHKCIRYVYGIKIVGYEPRVYVMSGSSNTTRVNVNNTGNTSTVKVGVSITGITGSVSPASKALGNRENYTFVVTLSASNDTRIGDYTGTFKAYKSDNEDISESVSLTVVVTAPEKRKEEINYTYQNYTLIVEGLVKELEDIKARGFVSEANLTIAERLINATKAILKEIEDAIAAGDYARAETLLDDLKTYTGEARKALDNLKLEQKSGEEVAQGSLITWIIIIVIIVIAAGFLVYMFLPERSGVPKPKGIGVPKPGIMNKLKGVLSRGRKPKPVAQKIKDYAKGYERHGTGSGRQHKEGVGGRLKRIFKRK